MSEKLRSDILNTMKHILFKVILSSQETFLQLFTQEIVKIQFERTIPEQNETFEAYSIYV